MAMQNPLLEAAEQEIEGKLLPATKADYMKIVVSGMKVAAHNGPNGLLSGLKRQQDPVGACALGAVNLVLLMSKQSKGSKPMPLKAMIPAGLTLTLQALDLVDKAGIAKIGVNELDHATHVFLNHLFKSLGITLQMLHTGAANVHQVMQDPTKMELINRKIGLVKAPGASAPTTLPSGEPT